MICAILVDVNQKKWEIGDFIDKGSYGKIYTTKNGKNIIKTELINETNSIERVVYEKLWNYENVNNFKRKYNLKKLPICEYMAYGVNGDFRFLVLKNYKISLEKYRLCSELGEEFFYSICVCLLYALEYMHNVGYAHCDIKAANILLDYKNRAYLADFGTANKFCNLGTTKMKGTSKFMSLDAYEGKYTRRSDLESLCYNLIYWLNKTLPWSQSNNIKRVMVLKRYAMTHLVSKSFGCLAQKVYDTITYVSALDINEVPDYESIRSLLRN